MTAADTRVPVLEIGGTHVTAALVDLGAGSVVSGSIHRDALDSSGSADQVVGAILRCGSRLAADLGLPWGVAVPGPFDYQSGVALFEGVGKFEALYGTDLRAALADGLPQQPVSVRFLNDADAFLLGEWRAGAAAGHDRCAGLTLGTGIGSAFLADGALRREGTGVPAEGRVDLLEVAGHRLEDVVSRRAIRTAYRLRTGAGSLDHDGYEAPDVAEIAARARGGDETARSVLQTAFETLGEVLGPWLVDFRATSLVVGGSMTGSWDLIGPALGEGLARVGGGAGARLDIRVAARPDHAALLGAAWHAAPGHRPTNNR